MAHFYIYGDESGKLAQSDYTSFCGYVGHSLEFERTMREWDDARFTWSVPHIHMRCITDPERNNCSEWLKIKNDWGDLWEMRRDDMLKEFSSILLHARLACVGCAVDAKHFRTMPDSAFKRDLKDPLFFSFYVLLRNAIEKVEKIDKSSSISIVVDDDEQYAMRCYEFLNGAKRHFPVIRERITAITFGNDGAYPALQMADMVAFESRMALVERMKDAKSEPSLNYIALTKKMLHQPNLCTAEVLVSLAVSWRPSQAE